MAAQAGLSERAVRGWVILTFTLLTGVIVGIGAAIMGPVLVAPYLPKSMSGQGERIQGEVVRKQRESNRLLVKVGTAQGPMLVTFTQKVAELDLLLEPGWTPPADADSPPTCTIITTTANELLAPIHDRMPVILDPDDEALWLDPGPIAPIKVLPCLRAFPSERMEAIPVSSLVSSPSNDGPQLVEPVSTTVGGSP